MLARSFQKGGSLMSDNLSESATKVKTFLQSTWNTILRFKEIAIVLLVFLFIFLLISMYATKLDKRVNMLEQDNIVKAEQLKKIEEARKDICQQLQMLMQAQQDLQKENDKLIKEAGRIEYKKAIQIPDADVLDRLNALIEDIRKRNSD